MELPGQSYIGKNAPWRTYYSDKEAVICKAQGTVAANLGGKLFSREKWPPCGDRAEKCDFFWRRKIVCCGECRQMAKSGVEDMYFARRLLNYPRIRTTQTQTGFNEIIYCKVSGKAAANGGETLPGYEVALFWQRS